jgi:MoaD family protein
MNIEVLFFGQFRELTAVNRRTVTVEKRARLADLIQHLSEEYGDAFLQQVDNVRGLRILINGREYTLLGGREAPLKDGDTVVFLPPIFGG